MKNYDYHIGIDVAKNTLDICILTKNNVFMEMKVSNSKEELNTFYKACAKKIDFQKAVICFENTGLYGHILAYWAVEKKLNLWMENALAIKRSLGLVRGKNDQVDAKRIALYSMRYEDKCKLWQPPRKIIVRLQQMITLRNRLVNAKKQLSTPLKEMEIFLSKSEQKETLSCSNSSLKGIEKDIKRIDTKIDQLIKSDTKISSMQSILTSINGVGSVVSIYFIVKTNEFLNAKSGKDLACYIGVAPFPNSSGTSVRGSTRVSPFANKDLKSIMHMGALSAIHHCKEFKDYYERKVSEGKPKMLVINAIKNKLILRMYACIRDNRKYEKNYTPTFA